MDKCGLDNCGGYVCVFHALRSEAQEYIIQLEIENTRLWEIERKARLVIEYGEPELIDEMATLLGIDL